MEKYLISLAEQLKEKIHKLNHEIMEHDEHEVIYQQIYDVYQGLQNDFDTFLKENEMLCVKLFSKIGLNPDEVLKYNKFSQIFKHFSNIDMENEMVKDSINIMKNIRVNTLTALMNELVKKRDNFKVNQLREEVSNYSQVIDLLWSVSNLKNMNKEQSLLLVDVLEKVVSSEEEFLNVMKFLIKGKVSSQKKQVTREKSITRMIVNKKAVDVLKEISLESEKIGVKKKDVSGEDFTVMKAKIDKSESKRIEMALSAEEKDIIQQLVNIFNVNGVDISNTDDKLYKKLINNCDLEIRKKLYFKDRNLDYNLIARDVNLNLRSMLGSEDKDKIMEIFRYIIEEDHKLKGQKIEIDKLYSKVKEAASSFESEDVLEADSDIIKNIKEEINGLINNTVTLLETIQEVMGSGIDNDDLTYFKEEFEKDMEQYEKLKSKLEEKRNELKLLEEKKLMEEETLNKEKSKKKKKRKYVPLTEVIASSDISDKANVLLFLGNGNTGEDESSLCVEDDLYADGMKDSMKDLQKLFVKAIDSLNKRNISLMMNTDNHKINKLKDNDLPDNRHFSKPWRLREGKARISFVVVNLCQENRDKIQMLYNLNDEFLRNGQVLLICGTVLADNDDYDKLEPLCKEIINNEDEIKRIINIFSNPASAKQLDQAIRTSNSIYVVNESSEELEKLYRDIDGDDPRGNKNGRKSR